jgi:REP element-mobilizing transposase RayT
MEFYRRRLPHLDVPDRPVFLTWRLYGSLPANRAFPETGVTSGKAFAIMDRLLDEVRTGPFYLRQEAMAEMVLSAIRYNGAALGQYELHAWVIMPNHVHLLVTPTVPLAKITKSLKGITARRANALLGLAGQPFWQDESYDHVIRNGQEFERIRNYIEENPVRAGLAASVVDFRWSSACPAGP